jgi:hypothetical protein
MLPDRAFSRLELVRREQYQKIGAQQGSFPREKVEREDVRLKNPCVNPDPPEAPKSSGFVLQILGAQILHRTVTILSAYP